MDDMKDELKLDNLVQRVRTFSKDIQIVFDNHSETRKAPNDRMHMVYKW